MTLTSCFGNCCPRFMLICRRPIWGVGCIIAFALLCCIATTGAAQQCAPDTVGIDAHLANNTTSPFLGEEPGETFLAPDSVLSFLRVWRSAFDDSNLIGMKLVITDTKPWGPPDLSRILYAGPTVVHLLTVPNEPTEFRWDFDPPLILPHTGHFAFFILQDPCVGLWDLLTTDDTTLYQDGDLWSTPRSSCHLSPSMQLRLAKYPRSDLVFQVGLCPDVATPARRTSWGRLKTLYR